MTFPKILMSVPRWLPALLVGLALLLRNLYFWNLYSVNVLYYDQWDFWIHMFRDDSSLWDKFDHQHGPHKMGIGYLYLELVAILTNWNVRLESLSLHLVSFITAFLFLLCKRRLVGRWHYTDFVIPFAVLQFGHYEIYFVATNPGLNVLPLFLVALTSLVFTLDNSKWRYPLLAILCFLCAYTGFAIFASIPIVLYCFAEAVRLGMATRRYGPVLLPLAAGLVSSVALASFFLNYAFRPAVPNFQFPHPRPLEYIEFLARYLGYFFDQGKNLWVSGAVAAAALTIMVTVLLRYLRAWTSDGGSKTGAFNSVTTFLGLFSLLFAINLAVGRISIGTGAGMTSRYLTFLVPLWVSGYLLILRVQSFPRLAGPLLFVALLLPADLRFQSSRGERLARMADEKRQWIEAYREHRDIETANEIAGRKMYPFDWAYDHQERLLEQMEARELHIFAEKERGSER